MTRLKVNVVLAILILNGIVVVIYSLPTQQAMAGWWLSRDLVTDGIDDDQLSRESAVATDLFGNVHVAWMDGNLDGSGGDYDVFYRKWNASTGGWGPRTLITDDNLNNTGPSQGPDVKTDSNGNVHIVWNDGSPLDGSGSDMDIFWRMWNVTTGSWTRRTLVSDDLNNSGESTTARLASDRFGNIHVTWYDISPEFRGSQYRKWNGTTQTWEGRMSPNAISANTRYSDIAVDLQGDVHIAWEDSRNISGKGWVDGIFHRKLDSVSLSWGPITHVNYDNYIDPPAYNLNQMTVDVLGNVYVVWEDLNDFGGPSGGDPDIYYTKWNATSESWEPSVLVSNDPANTGGSNDAAVCSDPMGNVHIVWGDKSDVDGAGTTYGDILYKRLDAVSDSLGNTKSLTNDLNDQFFARRSDIACDDLGNVIVVWGDMSGLMSSGPDWDIYLLRFEGDIALPDYIPVEVSPSVSKRVLTGSNNVISAKTYNGGQASTKVSTLAFYESTTPGSAFYRGTVSPLGTLERSPLHQRIWTAPLTPGTIQIVIKVDYWDSLAEVSEANNYYSIEFIVEAPPPPPLPPTNLTTEVVNGDDIRLSWTTLNDTSVDHYLIYRSTDQRGFDFSAPIYDTSSEANPQRTNWTDVDAANPSAPAEYYYVVRAVNAFGMKSATSNTAGKWTKAFSPGLNAFSIPLEPYYARNISWYADVIPNVERIRWMDPTGHWITHLETMDEGTRDTPIEMGRGYEIFLTPQTFFTFNGYPASMIRFQEGLGDTINYRTGLSAQTIGSDVILNWYPATGATQYRIFRSEKRNGLHDSPLQPVDTVPAIQTTWTDLGVLSGEGERYYIVIPVDSLGELGSGTYGVGVFTKEYLSGSDTFALPLKPLEGHSLDWYCDYIQNVVGIASMLNEMWKYHAKEMPQGVYDIDVLQGEGYQISIDGPSSKFTFVGY
ncbi:MAG: hypothetical protein KAR39_04320 [Thermoplasmata archaeon]|nr:hypothetical protein [Thermoplasmata archaeon]